jgi:hypothetical protein
MAAKNSVAAAELVTKNHVYTQKVGHHLEANHVVVVLLLLYMIRRRRRI